MQAHLLVSSRGRRPTPQFIKTGRGIHLQLHRQPPNNTTLAQKPGNTSVRKRGSDIRSVSARLLICIGKPAARQGMRQNNSLLEFTLSDTSPKVTRKPLTISLPVIFEASMRSARSEAGGRRQGHISTQAPPQGARCWWAIPRRSQTRSFLMTTSLVGSRAYHFK